jgi:D-alanyl-D-alanine carboxypeptidase
MSDQYNRSRYSRSPRGKRYKKTLIRTRVVIVGCTIAVLAVAGAGITWFVRGLPRGGEPAQSEGSQAPQTSQSDSQASTPPESPAASAAREPLTLGTSFADWNAKVDWQLRVYNVNNPLPEGMEVKTGNYDVIEVDERILESLNDMIRAAREDGVSLWISSGYRSVKRQQELFDEQVNQNLQSGMNESEAKEVAATSVAIPGTSEHNTGLAVDLNGVRHDFYTTEAYGWLSKHAAEYGFVERYPDGKQELTGIIFEPWHYRYVGKEAAEEMSARGLCLEEYAYEKMNEQ